MKFILLLIPYFAFAQVQVAKGVVLDKETHKPIPYVNISILESQLGTSSDGNGSYNLEIKEEDLLKNIHLSSLGYKDTMIVGSSFSNLKEVFLRPLAQQLDEVFISKKFEEKFVEVNPIKKKDIVGGIGGRQNQPYIFALYIPYKSSYHETQFVNKVKIFVNKMYVFGRLKSMASKFRFRIFSVGKDGLPDKDLIQENLIIDTQKKKRVAEINLSKYHIEIPNEGLYVAVEWLYIPSNAYIFKYTKGKVIKKKITETRYAPRLSWLKRKNEEDKLAMFVLGRWLHLNMPYSREGEYMIPAISLTLSN